MKLPRYTAKRPARGLKAQVWDNHKSAFVRGTDDWDFSHVLNQANQMNQLETT